MNHFDLWEQLYLASPRERSWYLARLARENEQLYDEMVQLLEETGDGPSVGESLGRFFERITAVVEDKAIERWSRATALVGQRFGAYEADRVHGLGGMGVVLEGHRADDAYTEKVAIKVLLDPDNPARVTQFQRERQALADLKHHHIARIYDGGLGLEGDPYLVMEWIDGVPITTYCETEGLGLRERLRLFLQVCEAVEYAHERGILHCDLKPSNILVTPDGDAKLIDFGLTRFRNRPGPRTYTPFFAAPEQVQGHPLNDRTDVYGLSKTLEALLLPTARGRKHRCEGRFSFQFGCRKGYSVGPSPPLRVGSGPSCRHRAVVQEPSGGSQP